jgi:hypothetical protein
MAKLCLCAYDANSILDISLATGLSVLLGAVIGGFTFLVWPGHVVFYDMSFGSHLFFVIVVCWICIVGRILLLLFAKWITNWMIHSPT